MKFILLGCWLLSGGVAWCAEDPPATPEVRPSLIANGNLEEGDAAGAWPAAWPKVTPGATWENEAGNHFLRLAVAGPETVALTTRLKLPKNTPHLRLSYRIRYALDSVDKPWHTAFVFVEFHDKAGKPVGPRPRLPFFSGRSDTWVEQASAFTVPKDAVAISLTPSIYGSPKDTCEIDDLALTSATGREVAANAERAKAAQLPKPAGDPESETAQRDKWPEELSVAGNQLHTASGKTVILQGLCVDALEWSINGEYLAHRARLALDEWKANALRVPFVESFWNGETSNHQPNPKQGDGGAAYRALIDQVVTMAANRGAYVILDLHRFHAVRQEQLDAWKQVAEVYKNHPAVLFEILNEPHGISWEVWRNGGFIADKPAGDEDNFLTDEQKVAAKKGFQSPGMQAVVEAIRATGAKNIIVAGGLTYSGDLSGVADGFALEDKTGNGIAYAWHQYWWHKGWEKTIVPAAAKFPIIVTECGASLDKMSFVNPKSFAEPFAWSANFLGFLQVNHMSYTAFSFHPGCGPSAVLDMQGTPTQAWGVFVKAALAGKHFEFTGLR